MANLSKKHQKELSTLSKGGIVVTVMNIGYIIFINTKYDSDYIPIFRLLHWLVLAVISIMCLYINIDFTRRTIEFIRGVRDGN